MEYTTKKLISIVAGLIILGAVGFSVWYFFVRDTSSNTPIQSDILPENNEQTSEPPEWFVNDRDSDGLNDSQEAELETSNVEFDTDGDTITDKDEVETYHTNPTNPDTDGDGYWDGLEIVGGYNPLGEGTLSIATTTN